MQFLPISRRHVLKQVAIASATTAAMVASWRSSLAGVLAFNAASIFVNQLGYLPKARKIATIALAKQTPASVSGQLRLRVTFENAGDAAFEAKLGTPFLDSASGDLVALADFSSVQQPGIHFLYLEGIGGDRFEIKPDIYADALRLTMRSYYGQRCGCKVDLGGGYRHPACHLNGAYHPSSGKKGKVSNHGGWHDAGDYGRYVVNSGITCGTLLYAWELYPRTLAKLALDIPESGGKTPDYLAEIRWNLEWMLSLQDTAGQDNTDGGVWHKQTSEQFCAFIMPQNDHLTSYVIGTGSAPYKSTGATADFAAVMAIAARCYGPYDDAFARRCLTASEHAYAWVALHPNVAFTNPKGVGTGGYDDSDVSDELLWAAAELFRTTGKLQYQKAFLAGYAALGPNPKLEAPGWGGVTAMACWAYALSSHANSKQTQEQIQQSTQTAAQFLIERGRHNGYGNTLAIEDYGWGSNAVAGNHSFLLFMANHFQPDTAAVNAALDNLHYLLGRNCHGVSWVTQLGARPFQHPHHRPSGADGIAAPWPGLLSGGPNRHPGDSVARTLPKMPPMRMWIDDQGAYSMNEIAINWNAPLVFLLAAANELAST